MDYATCVRTFRQTLSTTPAVIDLSSLEAGEFITSIELRPLVAGSGCYFHGRQTDLGFGIGTGLKVTNLRLLACPTSLRPYVSADVTGTVLCILVTVHRRGGE
jgi:hypothetical protein